MRVLSMIDSLIAAGAERMCVNIANGIARRGVQSFICATRSGGPLEAFILPDVERIVLHKQHFLDIKAFIRLFRFVRLHQIEIIHAHSSSVAWALLLKLFYPKLKVIWHDHYGFSDQLNKRSFLPLRMMALFIDFAFVVNEKLERYATEKLRIPRDRVYFLRNFASLSSSKELEVELPQSARSPKIVCLANIRPQKDHFNLLEAFLLVKQNFPQAVLYLVGGHFSDAYYRALCERIEASDLFQESVFILGSRNDVRSILERCDIGVLSSLSEGLPVSLLEYGLCALPVVCTDVGDCRFVLKDGDLGHIVPPSNPHLLAQSILNLLSNPKQAFEQGQALQNFVEREFSEVAVMQKIESVYHSLIKKHEAK